MRIKSLDFEYVKSLLHYNPRTGAFKWKVDRPPRGKKGQSAGCVREDGYLLLGIDGAMYMGHRVAWLLMTGNWPVEQIDHRNRDKSDTRWKNLREASHAQNKQNQGVNRNNKAGIKGVYKRKDCNRWCAFIHVAGINCYLGLFKTAKEAEQAYKTKARELRGEFAD